MHQDWSNIEALPQLINAILVIHISSLILGLLLIAFFFPFVYCHPYQDHCRPAEDECGSTGSLPDAEGHVRRSEDRWDFWQRWVFGCLPVDQHHHSTYRAKRSVPAASAKLCLSCIYQQLKQQPGWLHWLMAYLSHTNKAQRQVALRI